jgi:hypothetical protein
LLTGKGGGRVPPPALIVMLLREACPGAFRNKTETCTIFLSPGCRRFTRRLAGKNARPNSRKITSGACRQHPKEPPKLQLKTARHSYRQSIRMGGCAMTRKHEKQILVSPISASDHEAAVAEFIRNKGVTRCPTACLARTQASVPEADRTALEHYEASREQSRRSHLAATARLLGVLAPLSSPC